MSNTIPTPGAHSDPAASSLPPARVRTRRLPTDQPTQATSQDRDLSSFAEVRSYDVGYKKPPKHTQFKPGQSGNPKGKAKKVKSLHALVRDNLTQKVSVRTPTGEKKISRIEAVLHKTVEQAMKGNPRALAELIKLYGNAVPEEKAVVAAKERPEDLTATDLAILAALREELGGSAGDVQ